MSDLGKIAENCARQYFRGLLDDCFGETFYYFSLVMTAQANWAAASAWSEEALRAEAIKQCCQPEELRWSYADSPYCSLNRPGTEMGRLNTVFQRRVDMHDLQDAGRDAEWDAEFKVRIDALMFAMRALDMESMFAAPEKRADVVIMVDVYDTCFYKHSLRRLNPPETVETWLQECDLIDCNCDW